MNALTPIYTKQYRLAQHYLGKLRTASRAYQSGDENTTYGLKLAGQDWPQIAQWQAWTTAQAAQKREAAALCSAYSFEAGELLELLLTAQEHRRWRESALAAARWEGDQQAELAHLLALSDVHLSLNTYPQAEADLHQGLALARQIDDQQALGHALWIQGRLAISYRGDVAEGRRYFEESLRISRGIQDRAGIARNLIQLASVEAEADHTEPADNYASEALRIFRELGNSRGVADGLQTLGSIHIMDQDPQAVETGLQRLRESISLFNAIGDRTGAAGGYIPLVLGLFGLGKIDAMFAAGEEGLALCRQLGSDGGRAALLLNIGSCLFAQAEDLSAAARYCNEGLLIARQIGSPSLIGYTLWYVGFLAAFEGDFATGLAYGEESCVIQRNMGAIFRVFLGLNLMVFAAIGLGQLERARTHLLEAFSLGSDVNDLSLIAAVAAWLCLRLNKREQSLTLIGLIEAHDRENLLLNVHVLRFARQELEAALGAEVFELALEHGRLLDFDTTVAEIIAELHD